MAKYTKEEQATIDHINTMTHSEMAYAYRFHQSGHPYFDSSKPYWTVFTKRFHALGGWTSSVSKEIGWD